MFFQGGYMVWAFLGFLIFLVLIVFGGLRNYRKIPPEFADLANGLGITLTRAWISPGAGELALPVRYGSCYTGTYRDMATAICTVVDNEDGAKGTGLVFRFIRPLTLSFFCVVNIDPFTAETISDEYRDIYLKRIDTGIEALKAWAGDKDKAMMLLRGGDVYTRLEHLVGLIQTINGIGGAGPAGLRRAGFMVNDQGVALLVEEPAMLSRELVDEVYLLAQTLSGSGFGIPGGSFTVKSQGFKVLVMILVVLFMGFIIGVIIAGIFKLKITPIFSVWGLN
jgi:hypothetical protein